MSLGVGLVLLLGTVRQDDWNARITAILHSKALHITLLVVPALAGGACIGFLSRAMGIPWLVLGAMGSYATLAVGATVNQATTVAAAVYCGFIPTILLLSRRDAGPGHVTAAADCWPAVAGYFLALQSDRGNEILAADTWSPRESARRLT